jgi:hypothetical protein
MLSVNDCAGPLPTGRVRRHDHDRLRRRDDQPLAYLGRHLARRPTRFQVRVWLLHDDLAKKIATIYNTRRDKVNDSTAKYAYSETKEQEIARRLVNGSEHVGQDNIEVLANSVSAGSHKLTAFNTISRALETSRKGGPVTAADVEAQPSSLISARDSLVKVRPQSGAPPTTRNAPTTRLARSRGTTRGHPRLARSA